MDQQTTRRKRKVLNLQQRVEVVQRARKGESCHAIAKSLGCGKTQIQSIVNDGDNVLSRWEDGGRADQRYLKARKTDYDELNRLVYDWFCTARSKNIPITGKLLQEKALLYSLEMNLDDFTASNGWLHSFQRRNNIKASVLSGESADVPEEQVHDWCLRLSTICDRYEPKDIFNADETGLFYRALPERSLLPKGILVKVARSLKTV